MPRLILFYFSCLFLLSCASPYKKIQKRVEQSTVFQKGFTGFTLLDPETGKTLADYNGHHYFTPASNTKILTLYAGLKLLGDSLPALKYTRDDSGKIYFQGTGDPTFLHPAFEAWQPAYKLLKNGKISGIAQPRDKDERFGPGWSWDDYLGDYDSERSAMPIYGNLMRLRKTSEGWRTDPPYFNKFLQTADVEEPIRLEMNNTLYLPENDTFSVGYEVLIPIHDPDGRLPALLADTLGLDEPLMSDIADLENYKTIYSAPIDTVFRLMMQVSDNFLAEQLLMMCAVRRFGVYEQTPVLKWAKDSLFAGLPQPLKWVDGSGLSRYNAFTPQSIAQILWRMYREQGPKRLFSIFPAGGVSGTIADWYGNPGGAPYVFAKTGTLTGVHCLSGYIRTRKNRVLIFSFMHNNFVDPNKLWKAEMQRMLEMIGSIKARS